MTAAPAPLLTVAGLVAGYLEGVDILQGVDLTVAPGELVTAIGANGAGKSTLAKSIFGLVPIRAGEIHLDGQNITGKPPEQLVRLGLGYVPQNANVFPSLSVQENLEMGAYVLNISCRDRLQNLFDRFPKLYERRRQRAGTLSGGERQLLALARALMLSPKLLILDEPSAALSPLLVKETLEVIQQINAAGTAIILVEQNARKSLAIAQRGYVMDGGQVRFQGEGKALLHDPQVGELYLGTRFEAP
ncbi:MAG: ABC transporter ATP-binding protein [Oscillatoriales cyanobacterium SM2_1_8]|nr:ABC transporter ATP-binding protein [Oscillatoriales cyanobacterium SM2_1_8]